MKENPYQSPEADSEPEFVGTAVTDNLLPEDPGPYDGRGPVPTVVLVAVIGVPLALIIFIAALEALRNL